jgi:hypothetical protein
MSENPVREEYAPNTIDMGGPNSPQLINLNILSFTPRGSVAGVRVPVAPPDVQLLSFSVPKHGTYIPIITVKNTSMSAVPLPMVSRIGFRVAAAIWEECIYSDVAGATISTYAKTFVCSPRTLNAGEIVSAWIGQDSGGDLTLDAELCLVYVGV